MPKSRLGKGSMGIWNKKEQTACVNLRAGELEKQLGELLK